MKPKTNKEEVYIRVQHPDFGYVEFRGLTLRQNDVLKHYDKITNNKKTKTSIHKRRND